MTTSPPPLDGPPPAAEDVGLVVTIAPLVAVGMGLPPAGTVLPGKGWLSSKLGRPCVPGSSGKGSRHAGNSRPQLATHTNTPPAFMVRLPHRTQRHPRRRHRLRAPQRLHLVRGTTRLRPPGRRLVR